MARSNWKLKTHAPRTAPATPVCGQPIRASKPAAGTEIRISAAGSTATIRAAEGEGEGAKLGTFAGNAYTGAAMKPEGWWRPIVVDLAGVRVSSQHRPVLRQHDHNQIVGHTESVKVSDKGIEIAGVLSGEKQHTDKVTVPAKNGFRWQLSIGATPVRTEELEPGKTAEVNGREVSGPLTISRETDLGEISFVPLGADGDTSATVQASRGKLSMFKAALLMALLNRVKAAMKYSDDEIDKMTEDEAKAAFKKCQAEGDDPPPEKDKEKDDAAAKAKAKAKAAEDDADKAKAAEDDADKKADASAAARIKAARKAEADEVRRCAAIRATGKKYGVETIKADGKSVNFAAHAIEEGWTEDKAELEAMRAARPTDAGGPRFYSPSTPEVNEAVLECAVFQAAGGQFQLMDAAFYSKETPDRSRIPTRDARRIQGELNTRYTDKVQQAAHTMFKGRVGLQQVLVASAAQNGFRGSEVIRDDGDIGAVAHYANIRADGASTASIANVLANVQNKFLLQGYLWTDQAWKEVTRVGSVKDFKDTKSINLFGDFELQDVGASGELKNASIQDQAFANRAKTSGRILTISRTHIINDDLGALTTIPAMMGRGAGLKLNKDFWTKFLNPGNDDGGSTAFYAAVHTIANQVANSNLSSGAGSALSSAGLTAATLLFDNQVDPAGNPLGVDAEILLYPPDLQTAALELMNSEYVVATGVGASAARMPSSNIWKGRYRSVKARYMNKAAYTGYSATAWHLLANPNVLPTIEVVFLNGNEMPVVQVAGPDFQFNVLGITTRAVFDMGVEKQNFRGGVKSAGS